MIYQIDSEVWATPLQYAKERKVTKQVVYWWMKNNQLEIKELEEFGWKLVKRGSEKGSAKPEVTDTVSTDTKPIRKVIRRRNRQQMKEAKAA